MPEAGATALPRKFSREVLDQDLREIVAEETRAVRDILLAHTFSDVSRPMRSAIRLILERPARNWRTVALVFQPGDLHIMTPAMYELPQLGKAFTDAEAFRQRSGGSYTCHFPFASSAWTANAM